MIRFVFESKMVKRNHEEYLKNFFTFFSNGTLINFYEHSVEIGKLSVSKSKIGLREILKVFIADTIIIERV